jgi:hypothetical protein
MSEAENSALGATPPDFEHVRDFADIQTRFLKAARSIFFAHDLVYDPSGCRWQISALELYLITPKCGQTPRHMELDLNQQNNFKGVLGISSEQRERPLANSNANAANTYTGRMDFDFGPANGS